MKLRFFSRETRYVLKKLMKVGFIGLLFIFLVLNIAYSQLIPSEYFAVLNEDRSATVHFLKAIKKLPEFDRIFVMQKNLYGAALEDEIFSRDRERDALIRELEEVLKENPKSRDLLYNLYLLYNEGGDYGRAKLYYDKARTIDPLVGL